jgi:hypothetical protein
MNKKFTSQSDFSEYQVLKLNLKTEPFNVMITGEKKFEYRDIKQWSNSRLFNKDGSPKHYDYVRFQIAYQPSYPYFFCEYKGFEKVTSVDIKYSNGFKVKFDDERYAIKLGDIVLTGNLKK